MTYRVGPHGSCLSVMSRRPVCIPRRIVVVLVVLVAVTAGGVVAFATAPNGPGLSVDSASYELAATAYRDDPWRVPLVLNGVFPPGYSATIAGARFGTATAREAARAVNIACLMAIIVMVAAAVATARPRRGADAIAVPVTAALLLATSAAMLRWTGYVMAEVLSITAVVAAVTSAAIAVTRPRWLVVTAAAAGAAGLARHGALVTVPVLAVLVPMLVHGRRAQVRAGATIALGGGATWYFGTRLLLDAAPKSTRAIVWHPPGVGDLRTLVDTRGAYWLPSGLGPTLTRAVVLGAGIAAVVLIGRSAAGAGGERAPRPPLVVLAGGMALAQVIMLAVSKTWLDQAIVADDRLVLPVVPLVILMIGAAWPADTTHQPRLRAIGVSLVVVVLCAQLARTTDWIRQSRGDGIEYSQRRFATSPTLAAVRALPAATPLWTNDVTLLSLRAERQAFPVPARTNGYSGLADPGFEANLAALRDGLAAGGAVVYVEGFTYPRLLSRDELEGLVPGLVAEPFADGVILRAED